MRPLLKYGIPAAAGLATGGYAYSQGEDPGTSILAGTTGALGGAALSAVVETLEPRAAKNELRRTPIEVSRKTSENRPRHSGTSFRTWTNR